MHVAIVKKCSEVKKIFTMAQPVHLVIADVYAVAKNNFNRAVVTAIAPYA